MKKSKILSVLLAASLGTSLLVTGCGGTSKDEGKSDDGKGAKKITIFQQKIGRAHV